MSDKSPEEHKNAVAIIGMAGRFPGARDVAQLWDNLKAGRESVSFFTEEELRASEFDYDAVKDNPDFVKARGVLDDVDMFDAGFFGFNPREAAALDPQQRLWFECAWAALEDACCDPARFDGAIGVFAGGGYLNTYLLHNLCRNREYIERLVRLRAVDAFQAIVSNDKDFLPTRTSYLFNLTGPSVNVQTACSTSLVAVAQACRSLLGFESDVCLAGGISVQLPQVRGYLTQDGGMDSSDGHARVFDRRASGTVFSNGVGVVALKRLADALADRDPVRAVILGSAMNNDGANRVSFIAPSVEGQAEVVAMAQADAGVDPATITLIEAHGTATQLGDPIEVEALTRAFRTGTDACQYCAIGSIKSNIGHLDSAAGAAGLIKMVLAMQHRQIPPTINFRDANPEIPFAESPFFVATDLQDWDGERVPRRGGVSSFGVGGTNVHVVLEEAAPLTDSTSSRSSQLLLLSAKTEEALQGRVTDLAGYLRTHPDTSLPDVAYTLQVGRQEMAWRGMAVCEGVADGADILAGGDHGRVLTKEVKSGAPSIVFMFPGQGAQHLQMARGLYDAEPCFRQHVDACAGLLESQLETDLRQVMFPAADGAETAEELLKQTWLTQPALFVVEYALAQLWMKWGIRPDAMIGHSVGDYVAATVAGVFSLEDGLALIAERGRLMQEQPHGSMLAVRLSEEALQSYLNEHVMLAGLNAPELCVVSGSQTDVKALETRLAAKNIQARVLHTSHAFHSSMMDPVLEPFTKRVAEASLHAPRIPFVSGLTGEWIRDDEATSPAYWASQLRHAVRFSPGLRKVQEDADRVFLEVGPGKTLSTLAMQHPDKERSHIVVSSLSHPKEAQPDDRSVVTALGRLWLAGASVDWPAYYEEETRNRQALPSYPFQRQRYWVDPPTASVEDRPQTLGLAPTPAEAPTPPPQVTVTAPADTRSRRDRVLDRLRHVMCELSGMEPEDLDEQATFLEMGMDSLFLTQVSTELQNALGVQIKFRQLLEDVNSLGVLTDYVDAQLPAAAFTEPPPAAAPPPENIPAAGTGTTPDVIQQMQEQIHGMARQLEALSGAVPTPPAPELPREPAKPFGAAARIKTEPHDALSPAQRRRLDAFIEEYCEKTRRSKEYAAKHRSHLADPRAVSGFMPALKELVYPLVVERSSGSRVWDIDGNEYVDMVNGFGACLFGHEPPFIIKAIEKQLHRSIEVGPQHALVGDVAELMCEFTGLERTAFCNTGSEAVMGAMRVARTVTGKKLIAIFTNSYHGIHDEVLVRGTKKLRSIPAAPGVPPEKVENVLVLEYGSRESLDMLKARAHELAAIMVEPVQSRALDLQPREFLHELRRITHDCGAAFIMDEVINGFRTCPGGAQEYFGVRADIATYGKVMGGGMPVGAIAGRPRFMDALDGGAWTFGDDSFPSVGVTYFAGTFVRHPLAMAAAKAVLQRLKEAGPKLQHKLNESMAGVVEELRAYCEQAGAPILLPHFSSSHQFAFTDEVPYGSLFWPWIRSKGVHMWEGRTWFITTAHTDADVAKVVNAFKETVAELQEAEFLPRKPAGVAGVDALEQVAGSDRLPLSEAQQEIWFASQMSHAASCAYNESFNLHLRGPVNVAAMRAAVRAVYERHEAIHLQFSSEGDFQFRGPDQTIDVELLDFSDLDEAARAEQVDAAVRDDATTPFDLEKGPLVRAKLLRLTSDHHIFLSTAHHIVFDGWSAGVFIEEIATVYSAICEGRPYDLPEASSFSAYVHDEVQHLETAEGREAIAYWTQLFETPPAPLRLPADRSRPPLKSYEGGTVHWQSSVELYEDLKEAAKACGTTLYSVLLAGYAILLHRLSEQDDLVIGIPLAGQAVVAQDSLIGHCVNLLPLRSRYDGETSVREFIATMHTALLDAREHERCTFGSILRNIDIERDPSRSPLVEVVFNLNRDIPGHGFHGLQSRIQENRKRFTNWDMFFNIDETELCLTMDLDYNADILDESTVKRWIDHFKNVLAEVVKNADRPLVEVSLLTTPQRQMLLESWNNTAREWPDDVCIQELFETQAKRTPDATALVAYSERISYRELNERANRVAHYLRACGVEEETLVAIFMDRTADMVAAVLGVLKAGGAYVPLDPAYPSERLSFVVRDSGASVVLTQLDLRERFPERDGQVIALDDVRDAIAKESPRNLGRQAGAENLAYVIYTSGSTGTPKGVAIEHRSTVSLLRWAEETFSHEETAGVLAGTSLCFDLSVFELFFPLSRGASVILARTPLGLPDLAAAHEVTLVNTVPSAAAALLRAGGLPRSVRTVVLAGELLETALVDELYQQPGVEKIYDLYGPTEDTTYSTYKLRRPGELPSIGRPIANTQAYILDERMDPVPLGVPGELYLGGSGLARGYLHRPELTAERFVAHPFSAEPRARLYRTGDLVRYRPDGDIEFLGRTDHQIKIRGYRIEPGEIESILMEHPAVTESVVLVGENEAGVQNLRAYLVGMEADVDGTELGAYLRGRLPEYMVPASFTVLPSLPRTPSGKVERGALPRVGEEVTDLGRTYEAPRDAIELQLAKLWEQVLGVRRVGLHDNFFDLGGHSLLAVRMVVEVEKVYGKHLPLATLFQAPTIKQLAGILHEQDWKPCWSSLVPIRAGGSRPPLFLMHSHGGNVLEYHALVAHMEKAQPVYALQARGLDGHIIRGPTMEEMANHYVSEIRTLQPEGPYFLAGFCFGGLLAYEAAQQLAGDGHEVAFVGLVQAPTPDYPTYAAGTTVVQRYWYGILKRLALELDTLSVSGWKAKRTRVAERARRLRDLAVAKTELWLEPLARRWYVGPRAHSLTYTLEALAAEHEKALSAYRPAPCEGEVHVFPAAQQPRGIDRDDSLGWRAILGNRALVHEVPGHQQNILLDPHVREVASTINACLAAAQTATARAASAKAGRSTAASA